MSAVFPARIIPAGDRVHVVVRALSVPLDPLDFLGRLDSERPFYFERAAEGVAVAAVDEVPCATPGDAGDLLRVGGFAFDPAGTPGGPWAGFGRREWAVPRLALVLRDRRAELRAAATEAEGGQEAAVRRLDDAVAQLARPVHALGAREARGYRVEPAGSAAAWRDAVQATLADIEAGIVSKVVLARAARIRADAPWARLHVARRLRAAHPEATVFLVGRGRKALVGATPERLAWLREGVLRTAAVAGTAAPSAPGGAADRAFLSDPKERREHAIVVEHVRGRLDRVATGVQVPAEPEILSTPTLRHLHTPIRARLREGVGLLDVCDALHPTPAVCGLPRGEALSAVRAREEVERGWYAGGIGWTDASGGEVVVPLRAALLEGREALLFAGAGIVAGSSWEAELEEVRLKMRVVQAALLEL